jgi:hypothetical protein
VTALSTSITPPNPSLKISVEFPHELLSPC